MHLQFAAIGARESADAGLFGGKAAGLAALLLAGVDCPAGFCVSATTLPPESWSEEERREFEDRAAVVLQNGPAAVRSSAVGEDSESRSFAGLFETVLGVDSVPAAVAALGRCIRSGEARRVLDYASRLDPIPVGVVVQSMIEPVSAGVCFTVDPAGRDGAVVVEAIPGRGDRLVSGAAEPEAWRVYRQGTGGWEPRCVETKNVLSPREAVTLSTRALELSRAFGRPLDLEWAIDQQEKIWWLQARPVTAAKPAPVWQISRSAPDVEDGPVTLWSNWNVRETMPNPLFPLTWTLWRDVILAMTTDLLYGVSPSSPLSRPLNGLDLVHGRIYFNMNAMLAAPVLGKLTPLVVGVMDARVAKALRVLVRDGIVGPRRLPGSRLSLLLHMMKAGLVSTIRLVKVRDPRASLATLARGAAGIATRPRVTSLSDGELITEMTLWQLPPCAELRDGMHSQVLALIVFGLARWVFRHDPEAVNRLAMGTPANPTTRISMAVDELIDAAKAIRQDFEADLSWTHLARRLETSPEGRAWLEMFHAFLAEFGHRGPMEFDVGATRWSEDPSMILELVRTGLRTPSREKVAARIERLSSERDRVFADSIRRARAWKRPLMRWLKGAVERHMPLREAPKHYGVVVFDRMRKAARELGRRLAERGILDSADDVFFVEWPELVSLASGAAPAPDLAAAIEARRARFESWQRERAPDMLRSDGVPVEEPEHEAPEPGVLRGAAVSAGKATGPVRILREPDPRLMEDGDVLVVEYADPGWTPLFPRAAAVVMEIGGFMCHAAVVAREMGVASVFGVKDATRVLQDGDLVEVDGTAGTVRILDA